MRKPHAIYSRKFFVQNGWEKLGHLEHAVHFCEEALRNLHPRMRDKGVRDVCERRFKMDQKFCMEASRKTSDFAFAMHSEYKKHTSFEKALKTVLALLAYCEPACAPCITC